MGSINYKKHSARFFPSFLNDALSNLGSSKSLSDFSNFNLVKIADHLAIRATITIPELGNNEVQTIFDFYHTATRGCALQINKSPDNQIISLNWICGGEALSVEVTANQSVNLVLGYEQGKR